VLEEVVIPTGKKVYDLSNLYDESREDQIREEIRQKAVEIAEKVAREVMPGIVERVIREEIEKLKKA
jgi:chorismate mutase